MNKISLFMMFALLSGVMGLAIVPSAEAAGFRVLRVTSDQIPGGSRLYLQSRYDKKSGLFVYPKRVYVADRLSKRRTRITRYRPVRAIFPKKVAHRALSPERIAYCARKYKSFNPRTGKYRTYAGRLRNCR